MLVHILLLLAWSVFTFTFFDAVVQFFLHGERNDAVLALISLYCMIVVQDFRSAKNDHER